MWQRKVLLIVLAVLVVNLCNVSVARSDEIEWLGAEEYTLYWGDEINHSGYLIKASDFSPAKAFDTETDYVMLTITSIYDDSWGVILANNTEISNNTVLDDRLNITALEIVTGNDIPSPYTIISVAISNSTDPSPVMISWMDATLETEERNGHEVYIDERAYFTLEMTNLKSIPLESVSVSRSFPGEFVFDPDSDPMWNLSFDPYEKKTLEYSLKALKPGTYEFNGSLITVEYEGRTYSKELNSSNITVHGPFINISKSVSNDNVNLHDETNIVLNVVNEGDRAAHVSVSDQLPVGAVLISGDTDLSSVLHPDDSFSLSYSVRMDKAGDIRVPAATVEFVDSKEYEGTVYSQKSLIHVLDPDEATTAEVYDSGASDDNSYGEEHQDYTDTGSESAPGQAEEEQDHGKLQFLYDILGSITDFLKNTKDKIL